MGRVEAEVAWRFHPKYEALVFTCISQNARTQAVFRHN